MDRVPYILSEKSINDEVGKWKNKLNFPLHENLKKLL